MHCLVTRLHLCLGAESSKAVEVSCVCVSCPGSSVLSPSGTVHRSQVWKCREATDCVRRRRGRERKTHAGLDPYRAAAVESLPSLEPKPLPLCPCRLWVASQHDPVRHMPAFCNGGREKATQYAHPVLNGWGFWCRTNKQLNVSGTLLGTRPVPLRTAASANSTAPC